MHKAVAHSPDNFSEQTRGAPGPWARERVPGLHSCPLSLTTPRPLPFLGGTLSSPVLRGQGAPGPTAGLDPVSPHPIPASPTRSTVCGTCNMVLGGAGDQ